MSETKPFWLAVRLRGCLFVAGLLRVAQDGQQEDRQKRREDQADQHPTKARTATAFSHAGWQDDEEPDGDYNACDEENA
jgi:hypothetical protein